MNDLFLYSKENSLFRVIFRILSNIYERAFCGNNQLFQDEGPYPIETSPLICSANQRTGFYRDLCRERVKASVIST